MNDIQCLKGSILNGIFFKKIKFFKVCSRVKGVFKLHYHSCYENYLINICELEGDEGAAGYSLDFTGKDNIYIYLDRNEGGDFLQFGILKPKEYWTRDLLN